MSQGLDQTKAKIFDRMFEVSRQEDLQFLQQYFVHPERILKAESLTPERRFEYLQFALKNTEFERSLPDVQEILEQQVALLKASPELLAKKEGDFAATLEKAINDPETMFLALELIQDSFVQGLVGKKAGLARKVEAVSKPTKELAAGFEDKGFVENIRLTLLVKKAVEVDSIGLDELAQWVGLAGDDLKAVQKLIMKSIQLNLVKATIDKKTNRVYFLWGY